VANVGDTIENPFSGERITFLEVPSETNGDLLRFDWHIPPGFSIPEHVHVRQEERHEIVSGTLRGRIAGRERDFGRGERAIGPAGVPHAWRNPSDGEELRIVSELQPALDFEALLEHSFDIARGLKTDKMVVPKHLLRIAILLDESGGEFYLIGIPMPVWRAFLTLIAALARVGRLLGYEAGHDAKAPRMMRIERSVKIRRPPEEVFAFVADLRNDPRWVWTLTEARKTSEGPLGVGTTFLTVARFLGRRIEAPEEVTGYEPNRRLDTEGGWGPLRYTCSRIVEGVAGDARVTVKFEVRLGGFLGVAGPIFAPFARRQLETGLGSLKDVLEGRSPVAKDRGKAAKFLAAGLAGTILCALRRRRSKNRRTLSLADELAYRSSGAAPGRAGCQHVAGA
jgi:mannose-6-phosphate isomerase-like protein (cupin superfamily)/uncharacterized protein YndB with AHSA1/START domain